MRLTVRRNLVSFLVLMLAAILPLPSTASLQRKPPEGSSQNPGRTDLPSKPKRAATPGRAVNGSSPSNDNCAGAIPVTSNECTFNNSQDTTGASDEVNEPQSTCTLQANSVWYTFTNASPDRSLVRVSTCGSDFDTALMVYQVTGSACDFATFVPVACNDDNASCGDGFQSVIEFTAEAGQTYKIQAGGFDGETGSLHISIECVQIECPDIVVNGNLGNGSPDWPSTSGQQTPARLFRDGIESQCATPKNCPGPFGSGSFTFDAYTFTNATDDDQCVRVAYDPNLGKGACAVNAHAVAYLGSYNPANLCENYLADVGASDTLSFSFVVPPHTNFVIAIVANNPDGAGNGCSYHFTVTGNICEQFDMCIQDDLNPNRFIEIDSTTGHYRYRDCLKGITLDGTGVVTTSFCKIEIQDRGPIPKRPDREVDVSLNSCTHSGSATIRVNPSAYPVNLSDGDNQNNSCDCPD